eukprot:6653232-Ditylum_brightwellii.AAC.1
MFNVAILDTVKRCVQAAEEHKEAYPDSLESAGMEESKDNGMGGVSFPFTPDKRKNMEIMLSE